MSKGLNRHGPSWVSQIIYGYESGVGVPKTTVPQSHSRLVVLKHFGVWGGGVVRLPVGLNSRAYDLPGIPEVSGLLESTPLYKDLLFQCQKGVPLENFY